MIELHLRFSALSSFRFQCFFAWTTKGGSHLEKLLEKRLSFDEIYEHGLLSIFVCFYERKPNLPVHGMNKALLLRDEWNENEWTDQQGQVVKKTDWIGCWFVFSISFVGIFCVISWNVGPLLNLEEVLSGKLDNGWLCNVTAHQLFQSHQTCIKKEN